MAVAGERIISNSPGVGTPEQAVLYVYEYPNVKIGLAEIIGIVARTWGIGLSVGIRPDEAFAMMCHETAVFTFTGDVSPSQHNIGGIGTTGGGVPGISNPTWERAVEVFFWHLLAWTGDTILGAGTPRYSLVRGAIKDKGVATTWRSLGGRWGVRATPEWHLQANMPGNYGEAIDRHLAAILKKQVPSSMKKILITGAGDMSTTQVAPIIDLAAGHHNTDGGDSFEIIQTGELMEESFVQLQRAGFVVRALTDDGPDADDIPGDAMMPMGLQAVARKVTTNNPLAQYFIELHTEGGGGTGIFTIYPDSGTDVDEDVRDKLGPLISKRMAARTGMGVRAPGWLDKTRAAGVMSEKETGVGATSRLGIFLATYSVKNQVTRMIIEVGAHDKQPDLAIAKSPGFYRNAAAGLVDALREHTGYNNGVDTLTGIGKVPLPQTGTTDDPISLALKGWYATLPVDVQGNLSNATFYEATVDFSSIFADIQGPQRGIFGEFQAGWFHPTLGVRPIHPWVRVQLERDDKIAPR